VSEIKEEKEESNSESSDDLEQDYFSGDEDERKVTVDKKS